MVYRETWFGELVARRYSQFTSIMMIKKILVAYGTKMGVMSAVASLVSLSLSLSLPSSFLLALCAQRTARTFLCAFSFVFYFKREKKIGFLSIRRGQPMQCGAISGSQRFPVLATKQRKCPFG